jgi:hypothetical protein
MKRAINVPYEFNKAMLRLDRLRCDPEDKARLLQAVARSPQAARLYLHFLKYGCQAIDPHEVDMPYPTVYRLVKLFEMRGLIEKAEWRRGKRVYPRRLYRLVC